MTKCRPIINKKKREKVYIATNSIMDMEFNLIITREREEKTQFLNYLQVETFALRNI